MTAKLRESTLYRGAYLAVSLAVLFLDQWTKGIITRTMDVHQSRTIVPNVFDLTYVRNSGAAFGLFASVDSALKAVLLNSVAVIVFLIVSAYALRSSHKSVRLQVGLALILGGAVGNLLDRVRFGYVVDFLDFAVSGHHWPAFNVADSAICIGVAVLFLDMLRHEDEPKPVDAAPGTWFGIASFFRVSSKSDSSTFRRTASSWPSPISRASGSSVARPSPTACPSRRSWTSPFTCSPPRSSERNSSSSSSSGNTMPPTRRSVEVVRSGGVFYGGLIAATVVGIWYMKKHGLPAWRIADMGAPSIALGEAIGRWGCFAAGCCYGKESHGPLRRNVLDPLPTTPSGRPSACRSTRPRSISRSTRSSSSRSCSGRTGERRSTARSSGSTSFSTRSCAGSSRPGAAISVRGFVIPGVLSTSQSSG